MKEPELKSITELTKLLGKKTFSILLDDLITKISGKPTLVNIDDRDLKAIALKMIFKYSIKGDYEYE